MVGASVIARAVVATPPRSFVVSVSLELATLRLRPTVTRSLNARVIALMLPQVMLVMLQVGQELQ